MQCTTGSRGGVNVAELMVGLVIFGIIAVASVPGVARFMQSWRLNGEANMLAAALRSARSAAVSKNVDVVFVFRPTEGSYFHFEDLNRDGHLDDDEPRIADRELASQVHVDGYTTPNPWITFHPKGNTIDGGDVTLANDYDRTRVVRVFSGTGNVVIK